MKYEYKIIDTAIDSNPDNENELDYLGEKGWLLCAVYDGSSVYGGKRFYFTRPLPGVAYDPATNAFQQLPKKSKDD